MIDALRADHLGAYGYSRNTSPNIDELAREGVRFTNTYSSSSWTVPSVASIFTSLQPSVHRAVKLDKLLMGILQNEYVTLAELLSENGYETAGFVANPWVGKKLNFHQGFKTFEDVGMEQGESRYYGSIQLAEEEYRETFFPLPCIFMDVPRAL